MFHVAHALLDQAYPSSTYPQPSEPGGDQIPIYLAERIGMISSLAYSALMAFAAAKQRDISEQEKRMRDEESGEA